MLSLTYKYANKTFLQRATWESLIKMFEAIDSGFLDGTSNPP